MVNGTDPGPGGAAGAGQSETGEARLPLSGIALILLLGFIWGINWPAIRTAVTEISPWTFRVICLAVGAATLFATMFVRGIALRVPRAEIMPLVILALLNVTGYQLLTAFGLAEMEAGRGVIIAFTFPLWSVLLGTVVLREKLTGMRLMALCLGLAAMALLLGPDIARLGRTPLGAVYLIGSAISWAAATVMFKLVDWTIPSGAIAAWQLLIGGVPVLAAALVFAPTPEFSSLSNGAVISIIYASVIAVSFGQWIWFRVLRILPASVAAISTLAVPVVGVFSSAILIGERLGWMELTALALVVAALWIVLVGRTGLEAMRGAGRR
jgi:drug/metabolite transporter (DMT)-like permease